MVLNPHIKANPLHQISFTKPLIKNKKLNSKPKMTILSNSKKFKSENADTSSSTAGQGLNNGSNSGGSSITSSTNGSVVGLVQDSSTLSQVVQSVSDKSDDHNESLLLRQSSHDSSREEQSSLENVDRNGNEFILNMVDDPRLMNRVNYMASNQACAFGKSL